MAIDEGLLEILKNAPTMSIQEEKQKLEVQKEIVPRLIHVGEEQAYVEELMGRDIYLEARCNANSFPNLCYWGIYKGIVKVRGIEMVIMEQANYFSSSGIEFWPDGKKEQKTEKIMSKRVYVRLSDVVSIAQISSFPISYVPSVDASKKEILDDRLGYVEEECLDDMLGKTVHVETNGADTSHFTNLYWGDHCAFVQLGSQQMMVIENASYYNQGRVGFNQGTEDETTKINADRMFINLGYVLSISQEKHW